MREAVQAQFDTLKDTYVPYATFVEEIKPFAKAVQIEDLKKKYNLCAKQDKTVGMFDRLDKLQQ